MRLADVGAMRRNVVLVDLAIAIVAAVFVLILTPGLAVAGMIAIVVLAVCAISFRRQSRRRRRTRATRRATVSRTGRAGRRSKHS
jgi:multisubunit Na+/H+ antiporter MnhB subunit